MNKLKEDLGAAIMFITHDLGVVAETAQDAVVMYAGRVVEHAKVHELFEHPLHPYTKGLIGSIPSKEAIRNKARLNEIKGIVPPLTNLPAGCSFNPRCPHAMEVCRKQVPALAEQEAGHQTACWLYSVPDQEGEAA